MQINHVIDINFEGFSNSWTTWAASTSRSIAATTTPTLGLPAVQDQYSEINIPPGYQRLCGEDALAYVRYRHTDTDLVRSARQQDFLRQIKNQVGAGGLVSRRYGIEKIFGKYATTDIRSSR